MSNWIVKDILQYSKTLNYVQTNNPIYQPLRSGRIWHKVNF